MTPINSKSMQKNLGPANGLLLRALTQTGVSRPGRDLRALVAFDVSLRQSESRSFHGNDVSLFPRLLGRVPRVLRLRSGLSLLVGTKFVDHQMDFVICQIRSASFVQRLLASFVTACWSPSNCDWNVAFLAVSDSLFRQVYFDSQDCC